MKEEQLVLDRKEKIEELTRIMINNADGHNIVGDGLTIVRDSPGAKVSHEFADGIYLRRMNIKKGYFVIGAIHKHLHIWFLLQGNVTISKKEGIEDYIAPCYVISKPGDQRVIVANEDSIFVNIHKNPSNTQDIDELEKNIVCMNWKEFNKYKNTETCQV